MGHRVDAYRAALREVLARGDDPRHATLADLAGSADEVLKRRLRQVLVDRS
ncbi:MAG TPA: hypothetical protein VLM76_01025 [Patescibacteria group bacterium]|nr:hypothetical protein [Patescibacteria group bacterium]